MYPVFESSGSTISFAPRSAARLISPMPCATFASTLPIAGRIWMQATFTFASSLVVEPDESIALRSHARKTKTPEFAKRRSSRATPTQPYFKWPPGIGDDLDFAPQNCARVVNLLYGKSGAEEVLRFRDRHQSAARRQHADAPYVPVGLFCARPYLHHLPCLQRRQAMQTSTNLQPVLRFAGALATLRNLAPAGEDRRLCRTWYWTRAVS